MNYRLVCGDLETHQIQPGLLAPPIVCAGVAEWLPAENRAVGHFVDAKEARKTFRDWLTHPEFLIANVNVPFDLGCLCAEDASLVDLVFAAYAERRIVDPLVAEALHAIARGHLFKERNGTPLLSARGTQTERYSLDILVRHNLGRGDAKLNDFWKLRYALLELLIDPAAADPFHMWPEEAVIYPVADARNGATVTARQLGWMVDPATGAPLPAHENLGDLAAQCETDWDLHLGAVWGLRTDPSRVALLERRARELHEAYVARHAGHGFFREDGTRDTAAVARAVASAYGGGGVCGACGGSGRTPKREACRGLKHRGRFPGCGVVFILDASGKAVGSAPALPCPACHSAGEVVKVGAETKCESCRATGFGDLRSVPTTKTAISCSSDTLSESGDEQLMDLADNQPTKVRSTYVPYLQQGAAAPITFEPRVLVESARTSYGGVIQLFPTGSLGVTGDGEWVPTCRECFTAREGYVLGSTDYPAGELCALSQVCIWLFRYSEMARIINRDGKPGALHGTFGARIIGISDEEMVRRLAAKDKAAKDTRQVSKRCNFGLGGGMGVPKFVLTARLKNAGETVGPDGRRYVGIRFCIMVGGERVCGAEKVRTWGKGEWAREIAPTCKRCLEIATDLKQLWFRTFPEVREYHDWVKRWLNDRPGQPMPAFGPWVPRKGTPHRVRATETFPESANGGFQSFIADVTKAALRRVSREAYTDRSSVLHAAQLRVPCFQHDELFWEAREEHASEAGLRVGALMKEAYEEWIQDVRIEAVESALMRYWSKDAESVYEVLVDGAPDAPLTEHLAAEGWKPDKALAAVQGRRVVLGELGQAQRLAARARALGGTAAGPRLLVWEPAKK